MKKILAAILMFLCILSADAKVVKRDINTVISESGIPRESISVSVKNLSTGKTVYRLNDKILTHPASVQKILTLPAFMEILGEDYEFSTKIFKRGETDYLIRLGADPFFDSSDLKTLIKEIDKQTARKIFIDDSIIEQKDWGEGWQWDDDMNTSMPRFNSYNLDNNLMRITVMQNNGQICIINPSRYPLVFYNEVTIGDKTDVQISRDSSTNTITLKGTIAEAYTTLIPINNLKRYFNIKLTQALENRNIYLKEHFTQSKNLISDKLLAEIKHPITNAENEILKNSNNMMIEIVGKLAGGKAYKKTGTDIDGINVFKEFCKQKSIDTSAIRIVDASGVSKNNLVNTDFVTDFLVKMKDNKTLAKMAHPSEGTLSERMIPLKDNLSAKTGTLSDISSIAGFLTSKNGTKYAFCIIINDPQSSKSEKVNLEDYIIREIYIRG